MADKTLTVEQLCVKLGCGKSLAYQILNANEIESWTVGRKRVISEDSAYAYIAKMKAAEIEKQRRRSCQI